MNSRGMSGIRSTSAISIMMIFGIATATKKPAFAMNSREFSSNFSSPASFFCHSYCLTSIESVFALISYITKYLTFMHQLLNLVFDKKSKQSQIKSIIELLFMFRFSLFFIRWVGIFPFHDLSSLFLTLFFNFLTFSSFLRCLIRVWNSKNFWRLCKLYS